MIYSQVQTAPLAIIYCLVLLAVAGAATLLWGRRLPRGGDWLVGVFLAFLFGALLYAGNSLLEVGGGAKIWIRGWIWPVDSAGSLAIGLLQDPLGLVMAGLILLFSAVLLANGSLTSKDPRPERLYSAVAFSAAGSVLSWIALTPWFSFLGLVLATFGGFLALGSNWNGESESRLAIRFARQRYFGLFLSVLGACGICGGRGALLWLQGAPSADAEVWIGSIQSMSTQESLGLALLIIGLLIQFQPVFLLGWLVSPGHRSSKKNSAQSTWSRIALTQVLPGWSAFAILLRLQNHLGGLEHFTIFGWFLLASSAGSVFSGLLQTRWESGLTTWLSSGLTFSAAVLCFGNCAAALSLIIGLGLGATAFAMSRCAVVSQMDHENEGGKLKDDGVRPAPPALSLALFLGVAAASGVVGFGSAEGWSQWVSQIWMDPVLSSAGILTFVLVVVLGWKQAWTAYNELNSSIPVPGVVQALPLLLVFLSVGIFWTGAFSGGVIPGAPDRVFTSLIAFLFSAAYIPSSVHGGTYSDYLNVAAVGASFGAVVIAAGIAFWAAKRMPKNLLEGEEPGKRFYRFIASGYGTEGLAERTGKGLVWLAEAVTRTVDEKIWSRALPKGLSWTLRGSADQVTRGDRVMSEAMRGWARLWVDPPAKFLQLIQSGDVQWYLVFGLGSGFAILIHFLWNSNASFFK